MTPPPATELHLISIDDDFHQRTAICSQGDFRFESSDRDAKMAASYAHLAEIHRTRAKVDD